MLQNHDAGLFAALNFLSNLTKGRLEIWDLAGSAMARNRAFLMSTLMGWKVPQSKSGVYAIREEFWKRMNVQGSCIAAKDDAFKVKAKDLLATQDKFELFYSDGGHGGPYIGIDAARQAANDMLRGGRMSTVYIVDYKKWNGDKPHMMASETLHRSDLPYKPEKTPKAAKRVDRKNANGE